MDSLRRYLDDCKAAFEIIAHQLPIYTVKDAARYYPLEKTAPVFIIRADGVFYALILAGQRGRIDFKALKGQFGFHDVSLADEAAVIRLTGCKIGSVPIIGLDLEYIFDDRLLQYDFVYGGTGNACYTLKINPFDICAICQAEKRLQP